MRVLMNKRGEALGLFDGASFVSNGSFRSTRNSDMVADGWTADGPIDALTVLGGQGMAARSGGRLWQRVQVKPYELM